jgi:hypothetical protein
MTEPDERPPPAHDPEVAEEYAESVGIDPSPDEIRRYQELLGVVPPQTSDDDTDDTGDGDDGDGDGDGDDSSA